MQDQNPLLSNLTDSFADPRWRLENLYRISTKLGENALFSPNAVQQDLLAHDSPSMVVLKARQQGVSTLFELIGFDEVLWHNNYWVAIIAHHRDTLDILFTKIQYAWDNLDPELKAMVGEPKSDNKYELYWRERDARIYVALEVLGGTNHRVHFSEYALIDPNRVTKTLPTVPPNGRIVKESTPFGTNNKFYRDYIAAKDGKSHEVARCYLWHQTPEYRKPVRTVDDRNITAQEKALIDLHGLDFEQIEWRRAEWDSLQQPDGSNMFLQTYIEDDISCFMASGDSVFDATAVKSRLIYTRKRQKPFLVGCLIEKNGRIKFEEDKEGPLKVYEAPKRDFEYVGGADISLGGPKSDDQVTQMLKRGTLDQVAVYKNRTEIGLFAEDTANLCKWYNTAHICPERNSIGEAFIEHLLGLYPNQKIYRQQNRLQTGSRTRVSRFGYATTRGRNIGKQRLITLIQDFLRSDGLVWDDTTLEQMLAYQKLDLISPEEGFKTGAKVGNKDDYVIAFGLALEQDSVLPVFKPKIFEVQDVWGNELEKQRKRRQAYRHMENWLAY